VHFNFTASIVFDNFFCFIFFWGGDYWSTGRIPFLHPTSNVRTWKVSLKCINKDTYIEFHLCILQTEATFMSYLELDSDAWSKSAFCQSVAVFLLIQCGWRCLQPVVFHCSTKSWYKTFDAACIPVIFWGRVYITRFSVLLFTTQPTAPRSTARCHGASSSAVSATNISTQGESDHKSVLLLSECYLR